jgi:aspartate 1-decarboxylase
MSVVPQREPPPDNGGETCTIGGLVLHTMLSAKIHRATVTETDIDYEGSIAIDAALLAASGIREFEKVDIFDINNGNRFETYVIKALTGSGKIGINGAAARLVARGDKVIIVCYGIYSPEEIDRHKPRIVIIGDEDNLTWKVKE